MHRSWPCSLGQVELTPRPPSACATTTPIRQQVSIKSAAYHCQPLCRIHIFSAYYPSALHVSLTSLSRCPTGVRAPSPFRDFFTSWALSLTPTLSGWTAHALCRCICRIWYEGRRPRVVFKRVFGQRVAPSGRTRDLARGLGKSWRFIRKGHDIRASFRQCREAGARRWNLVRGRHCQLKQCSVGSMLPVHKSRSMGFCIFCWSLGC